MFHNADLPLAQLMVSDAAMPNAQAAATTIRTETTDAGASIRTAANVDHMIAGESGEHEAARGRSWANVSAGVLKRRRRRV
jgi:hypothetical protein